MPSPARLSRVEWLAAALVALSAAAAFAPVFGNGWVHWDDDLFILGNPHIRSLSPENLRWMATAFVGGTYQPLGWLSYAWDFTLWGLDPRGFHLTSLLLHAINAALAYFLVLRLLREARGSSAERADVAAAAAFGALTYALHPLRVEAVAWASERRQQLAVALVLSSMLANLVAARGPRERRGGWLAASLGLLALSAAAKAQAIAVPIVLLVLDGYPLRRKALLEKAPFILAAALAAALGFMAQARAGSVWDVNVYGVPQRLAQAGFNLAFYARKTAMPFGLSPLYAVPLEWSPWEPRFIASWAFVIAVTALAWRARKRFPGGLAAWACYVALLLPVLGLAQSGRQFAADRYGDLACLGGSVLAGAGWLAAASSGGRLRAAAFAAGGAALLALAVVARRQIAVWRDPISMWSRAVELEPWSPIARDNLGVAFARVDRPAEAARQFEAVLVVDPFCADARASLDQACRDAKLNLPLARAESGDLDGAIEALRRLLAEEPGNEFARRNLEHALELKAAGGAGSPPRL